MTPTIPNQFPSLPPPGPARIALIVDAPGRDEMHFGVPLCGNAGAFLDSALGHVGIVRASCFVGHVCRSEPPRGSFDELAWEGEEIQSGIAALHVDLQRFQPSIVVVMGGAGLHLFSFGNVPPSRKRDKGKVIYDWKRSLWDWRGSLWWSEWGGEAIGARCGRCDGTGTITALDGSNSGIECRHGVKCLALLHPSACVVDYSMQAYYRCAPGMGDLERLRVESRTRELELPVREIEVVLPSDPAPLARVATVISCYRIERKAVSCDIEGAPGNVTCIAFSSSPGHALVIPFAHIDGTSVWSENEEIALWEQVRLLIEDPLVPKVAMHGTYDFFALLWTYGIVVRNWDDIEVSFWELFAELKKSLAKQASLLTKEPFYKPDVEEGELKFESDAQFWEYNGRDAAVTIEIWQRHCEMMTPGQREHYRENRELFPSVLYMMTRGILVDRDRVKVEQDHAMSQVWELQAKIDVESVRVEGLTVPTRANEATLYDFVKLFEGGKVPSEETFAWMVLHCLGGKNPRKRVEVVEERWQSMRWNGKKWVKDGKLLKCPRAMLDYTAELGLSEGFLLGRVHADKAPEVANSANTRSGWIKPMHRTVTKLFPFTPVTLSDCEEFILGLDGESEEARRKQRVWRRVKAIWKELKYEYRRSMDGDTESQTDADTASGSRTERAALSTGTHAGLSAPALLGELSTLLGLAVNVSSTNEGGDSQRFLFETCGLPRVWKDERTGRYSKESESDWEKRIAQGKGLTHDTRRTEQCEGRDSFSSSQTGTCNEESLSGIEQSDESTRSSMAKATRSAPPGKRLSTDQQALDKLYAETQDVRVLWCLQQRRLKKVVTDLDTEIDADGRLRASISLVKETGRMAESASPTGTGLNRQALNKDLRVIGVADPGCELCQCDLEGADSWTVATECAALSDRRMLDDLLAGMKPAKGLCYGYFDSTRYATASPQELKELLKTIVLPEWLYPGAKEVTHGSCYGSGWKTVCDTVLKFSMADLPLVLADAKPVMLTKPQVEKLQGAFFSRYPGVKLWHAKEARDLLSKGYIETGTGHIRKIYGRKVEIKQGRRVACHETLKEVLSSKPQYFTTRAIKVMLRRLWYDPMNRRGESLIVEPLLAVHDSLMTQWGKSDGAFGRAKMREWFQNPVTIAEQTVMIPADGMVARSWAMKDGEKL
jgi:hypothetical protein